MIKKIATGSVTARVYTSSSLALLAMDWPDGADHPDFLGFAISRTPGFGQAKTSWLGNKIDFSAPIKDAKPFPSNVAPFQKFLWWDSSVSDGKARKFAYTITPVTGTGPADLVLQHAAETTIDVEVPGRERDGIWTCFNRAVVSSQAFSREFPDPETQLDAAMKWLANGIEDAFPEILDGAPAISGAIYHLTDNEWVVPALKAFEGPLELVYEKQGKDHVDDAAIAMLDGARFQGFPRSKTHIMHDKFLVDVQRGRLLAGSANFTPEGLTTQANLLHVFTSQALADLFLARAKLIQDDPSIGETAKGAAWSAPVEIGKASVRVFFSPEAKPHRTSIDTVVDAVKAAKSSVVFCMFDPTDPPLLDALLATSDDGRLLYGLLNSISDPSKKPKKGDTVEATREASGVAPLDPSPGTQVQVQLFNRSRSDHAVVAYDYFRPKAVPVGFLPELSAIDLSSKSTLGQSKPGGRPPPAVHIHHKFIVIDAETANPTIFTGSANLSKNSTNFNDENLLEITGSPELAQLYFAEFMRLYEQYRARALWDQGTAQSAKGAAKETFTLKTSRDAWVKKAYQDGSLDALARSKLAASPNHSATAATTAAATKPAKTARAKKASVGTRVNSARKRKSAPRAAE